MKLDADLFSPGNLQKTGGLKAVVGQFGVGGVVDRDNLMFLAEVHHPGEELFVRHRRGGIVGVVEKEGLGVPGHQGRNGVKVRQEAVLPGEGEKLAIGPGEQGAHLVDRVAGRGHEVDVLGVVDPQGQVGDALLGADEGEDFALRVQVHPEPPLIPAGHRLPKVVHAGIGRIPVRFLILDRLCHLFDDEGRGGKIRVPHAQVDDIHAPGLDLGLLFVNGFEEIGGNQAQASRGFKKLRHLTCPFCDCTNLHRYRNMKLKAVFVPPSRGQGRYKRLKSPNPRGLRPRSRCP